MKKDFSVECWFFNQSITARIVITELQVYREYHPIIISGFSPTALKNYCFISSYDGCLELNQSPADENTGLLLKELAEAIETKLRIVQQPPCISRQSIGSSHAGGPSSAAA